MPPPFTDYYQSQIGSATVINYGYTDMPWRLLFKDIYYFFYYIRALPSVVWPLRPYGGGKLDELYPSRQNLFCIGMHVLLVILQLIFILSLPVLMFLPIPAGLSGLGIVAFLIFNWLLCKTINGKVIEFHSDPKYAQETPENRHEQWVFLNGVAVG